MSPREDQTALVIGGGAGIGRATSLRLGRDRWSVVVVDRDPVAAEETAREVMSQGGHALSLSADVGEEDSLAAAFESTLNWRPQVHALVNSAGIQGMLGKRSHEVPLADLDSVYRVNLRGALAASRTVLPHMIEKGYGRIVQVASIAGKEGNPNMISYSSTKAGLIGMVKAQGKEYATDGITVNAVAPAVIRTPFLDSQPAEVIEYMKAKIPMARFGTPEEVAALIGWVVSQECSFVTGFTFDLSGGRATY